MDKATWEQTKAIIGEALELPPGDRGALVEARCSGNEAWMTEVRSLLAASESSAAVLNEGADAWVGAASTPVPLPVQGRIGSFQILRLIAESPGAAVYLAHQNRPERQVALKVLRTAPLLGTDPRFWLEATAAARVEHPSVVRIYEAGLVELSEGHRAAYISMEYVEGVPVTQAVREQALDPWRIAALMGQIAHGVARIHQCGVIHRDLKPSNVLVDGAGRPRVLDFGVARLLTRSAGTWHTLECSVAGTPGYLSPEGIERPDSVDVRSDVWALGAMAYELLSGAAPFVVQGATPLQVLRRTALEEVPRFSRAATNVPPDLEAVVMKALARSPSDRYSSASAFADDLENARLGRPVSARKATIAYRASRFMRRNALALTLAGAVLAAMLGLGTAQVVAWSRAAHERARAAEVVGLIRGMISSADPNFGRRDARMLEVLQGLETQLNAKADLDELTSADVRSLLGAMYFSLGDYARSRVLLEAAINQRENAGAGDAAEAFMDRAALVQTLRWLYELNQATTLAERTLALTLERFGPLHPATLAARDARAGCFLDAQDFGAAEREYRELLEHMQRIHGPDARETLAVRGNLASLLSARGQYAEAELALRDLLNRWELHPNALETLTTRLNLASVLAEQGKLDLALEMLSSVEREAAGPLGSDHPTLVTARTNAIEFLRRSGREAEALERSTVLLRELSSTFGPAHDLTLTQVTSQVAALIRAGRAHEAVALARASREASLAGQPDTSPWHARLDSSLASALGAAGQFENSVEMHRSAIRRLEAQLGPDHRQTLVASNNLGVAQIEGGNPAAARELLLAVLSRVIAAGYEEMHASVLRNLGRAQLADGDSEAGVRSLTDAYSLSVRRQELANAQVCARLLAEYYARGGDAESARLWQHRSEPPVR